MFIDDEQGKVVSIYVNPQTGLIHDSEKQNPSTSSMNRAAIGIRMRLRAPVIEFAEVSYLTCEEPKGKMHPPDYSASVRRRVSTG